jgi:hypothetical protein
MAAESRQTLTPSEVFIPDFLDGWKVVKTGLVRLRDLRVRQRSDTGNLVLTDLTDTPHYRFAKAYLDGMEVDKAARESGYLDYSMKHVDKGPDAPAALAELIDSIGVDGYLGGQHANLPVLLCRHKSRPWNPWVVLDGFHRAAVLAAMGVGEVLCAYAKLGIGKILGAKIRRMLK